MVIFFSFSSDDIEDIVASYRRGEHVYDIANRYDVSQIEIRKVLDAHNKEYFYKTKNGVVLVNEHTTKVCPKCGKELVLSCYNRGNGKYGRRSICKDCEHSICNSAEYRARRNAARDYRRKNIPGYFEKELNRNKKRVLQSEEAFKKMMLRSAKERAKAKGIPFDITIDDFSIPDKCPLLGIELKSSTGKKSSGATGNSPSLDRIRPELGYVKGNVWVISYRANMIKNNASLEELELLVKNLKDHWIH